MGRRTVYSRSRTDTTSVLIRDARWRQSRRAATDDEAGTPEYVRFTIADDRPDLRRRYARYDYLDGQT
jgi:hypothetical protein